MGTADMKTLSSSLPPFCCKVRNTPPRGVRGVYPLGGRGQFLFAGTNILKKKISGWGGVGKIFLLMPQNAS